jgi:hypothetical protein
LLELLLRNKPGRIEDICEAARLLLKPGAKMGFKDALSLRSKVSFAEGQTHAKATAPLARMLSIWATVRTPRPISEELDLVLRAAVKHLGQAGPKVITSITKDLPTLVFLDGACEDVVSIGGVMISPGGQRQFFGAVVREETVGSWKSSKHQLQVIGQAELFPLIVARLTWPEFLSSSRVIYFIDNESARIAAIKAYSPVLASLNIIVECIGWDYSHGSSPWYARVPTCANIADGPSRMCGKEVRALLNASCVVPVFPFGHVPAMVLR